MTKVQGRKIPNNWCVYIPLFYIKPRYVSVTLLPPAAPPFILSLPLSILPLLSLLLLHALLVLAWARCCSVARPGLAHFLHTCSSISLSSA